ncbi:MAG: hypothetical protein IMW89_06155 [Ktedonobacteraceae bacterium]|nr:hypothetical protein [Ktedonobacteraceae bacterium]
MVYVIWTVVSIAAYIIGLFIIWTTMPRLLVHSYDEGSFMGFAALAILGAILVFGAVAITFAVFSGAFGIRVLDFIFLVGIFLVGMASALKSFRPAILVRTHRSSRIMAGVFCLCLATASLYYVVQIFVLK